MTSYIDFLESKRVAAKPAGFEVQGDIREELFPFQREIVRWALRLGRAALFEECGLGKTLQQLAWAEEVNSHTRKPVLILTPLAVAHQTAAEAEKFGFIAKVVSQQSEVRQMGVNITNYQKLHHFDAKAFSGVVLDESSILKSFMGSTKRKLVDAFADTPFKLCCTATPAPNDHMELGNHAEFLGVMPANEMLSRWFINDQAQSGNYRLKGHAEKDFWAWVASWACCIGKPSDLGYSDDGFNLPPLDIREHIVSVDVTADAGDCLFRSDSLTATGLHKEMRRTARARAERVAKLVNPTSCHWIVWCNTDYEAVELMDCLKQGAVEVSGRDNDAAKEAKLNAFSEGKTRVLVSKPSVCGFGMNWQHCNRMAFVGLSYSFEQFYQAVRRSWRFGQTRPVEAHLVIADTEGEVLATVRRKQADHLTMQTNMVQAVREHFRTDADRRQLRMDVDERIMQGDGWTLHHNDCVEAVKTMADDSIDFTIFSPPFANLYIYSDSYRDMGNAADDSEFFKHFGFLIPELLRVTVPGRLCAVHCKDLPLYRNRDGACGLSDFPGEIVRQFNAHGWIFHSRVTIWKCPVVERERTNNNGLLHKTVCRDSSQIRQGMADYLLVFRKNPLEDNLSAKPIERPAGFDKWVGDPAFDPRAGNAPHPSPYARKPGCKPRMATLDDGTEANLTPSVNIWQRYADPVWFDIDQMDVLNIKQARDGQDEKHICPLQLGVIRRAVSLWTNPGDLVLSPFAGIGSELVVAIEEGRRAVGVELKESYWRTAANNCRIAAEKGNQGNLFDTVEARAA